MAWLSDKGVHCHHSYCKQLDFLPFKCESCKLEFCSEHYRPEEHSCLGPPKVDKRVMICPYCLENIQMIGGEDPNISWQERHAPHCRPSMYEKRKQQSRGTTCPVSGCREKLTEISSFRCRHCNQTVCLQHRSQEDHICRKESTKSKKPKATTVRYQAKTAKPLARFGTFTKELEATAHRRKQGYNSQKPSPNHPPQTKKTLSEKSHRWCSIQ
ncbi:AN1 family Zinc finger domain-containing protein [Cardiosporidium cionae]|uniref:AN1 family Zinc finger domain-containing protein n=1 Tax=Cardiosporidium cionae TaxID=476202 RepID=A0ABQ7JEZ8_9APIC|nr:AN1 family Zinc finger domain-containing protein [Cardiosporidium cionae]|eukprot:KAF8822465.1 AN1 family Zinc finger domain-containing protein [Cardiosporidium cionae]